MRRIVGGALLGALLYSIYRADQIYPTYAGGDSAGHGQLDATVRNAIDLSNPPLYFSAAAGAVLALFL